jgi:imidazolonepropionase
MTCTDSGPFLLVNCRAATMADDALSEIEQAAIAVSGAKIEWVGKKAALPAHIAKKYRTHIDCQNSWVLPGFVDCHTHTLFAGSRSHEFELRLAGVGYEEIARQGGGILSTVTATRNAGEKELYDAGAKRILHFIQQGVTCLEIKTGYGLNLDTELKMLTVIGRLNRDLPIHIEATFLGAHALPPEFGNNSDGYISHIIDTMIPQVKKQGIAGAVDMFCESIAFSKEQTRAVFNAALALGFKIKLHAEQLSDSSGAALAAKMGALSCDHLEYLSKQGARTMAENGTVAVLLPGAFYFLNETQKPPVQRFRDLKIPMALATDLNPGSSPVHSMPLVLNMACVLFGLTCEEALLGATLNGAKALGLDRAKGSIEPGKDADLTLWDIDRPADLCYLAGLTPLKLAMAGGHIIVDHLKASTTEPRS